MNENYKQINEDQKMLSLTGLCVYVLKKWKVMLIAAVITAIVAGALFTVKDYQEYKANQGTEQMVAASKKNVPETVKASVLAKIETIESYRETIANYEYYYANSIKVKLDPNNIYQGSQEYLFSAANSKEMLKAVSICEEKLFVDENYEELLACLEEPTDVTMLKEVIGFSKEYPVASSIEDVEEVVDTNNMTFRITVRHYNEADCEKMHAYVEKLMGTLQSMLDEEGVEVEVSMSSSKLDHRVDRSIPALGRELRMAITTIYENIATIETKMSDEEADYYEYLLKENSKAETNTPVTTENVTPLDFLNVLMIIVGAFVGAIGVAAVYALLYITGGFVHNKEELKSWLNIPVSDLGSGADMLTAFLSGVAAKNNAKKIYLTGTLPQLNSEVMNQVKDMFADKDCEVIVGNSVLKDARALQDAADCGCMILFEKCYVTKEKDIKEAILKASSCGIKVLSIVLEK